MVTGLSRRVSRPTRRPRREGDLTNYVAGTAAGVGLLLLVVASVPSEASQATDDHFGLRNRYIGGIIRPVVTEEREPAWATEKSKVGDTRGKRARGEEGKAGDPKSRNRDRLAAVKGDPNNPSPHLGRPAAEAARDAGILGALRRPNSDAMTSIFSRHDSAIGRDATNALGGLVGLEIGDSWGVGGLGIVGPGRGGGGTGDDTFGPGGLGTIGRCVGALCGPGLGRSYQAGVPTARLSHQGGGPEVVGGMVKTRGGLDREIIRRTIRAHIKEVKFCYEQELIRKPGLYGRVTVQFTITPTGAVSSAAVQASTVGDARVEQCIAHAVGRWEFPRPENGSVTLVTYPFVLQAAGGR